MAAAGDAKEINRIRNKSQNTLASGPFPPDNAAHIPPLRGVHNLKKAKALAKEYEQKHGEPISFEYLALTAPETIAFAELVKEQQAKAGIDVSIRTLDLDAFINDALAGNFQSAGWLNHPGGDPDTQYSWWHSGSPVNFGRINDPVIDKDLEAGRVETDPREAHCDLQGPQPPLPEAAVQPLGVVLAVGRGVPERRPRGEGPTAARRRREAVRALQRSSPVDRPEEGMTPSARTIALVIAAALAGGALAGGALAGGRARRRHATAARLPPPRTLRMLPAPRSTADPRSSRSRPRRPAAGVSRRRHSRRRASGGERDLRHARDAELQGRVRPLPREVGRSERRLRRSGRSSCAPGVKFHDGTPVDADAREAQPRHVPGRQPDGRRA